MIENLLWIDESRYNQYLKNVIKPNEVNFYEDKVVKRILVALFGIIAIVQMIGFDLSRPIYAKSDINKDVNLIEISKKAYIYVLPLYVMYRTRWHAVFNPENPYGGMINDFRHSRMLADPASRAVSGPNNDTLYSGAWLDLKPDPLVLHVPDTDGRYYSVQFLDFYTNNFASIGRRTTGTREGDYLVIGPDYEGETPRSLPVIKSPTNAVLLTSRFLIDGPEDLLDVFELQNQLSITSLSSWMGREPGNTRSKPTKTFIRPNPEDPFNHFTVVNLALTENPPPRSEKPLIQEFKKIGVGPGQIFDPKRFSDTERGEILLGIQQAKEELKAFYSQVLRSKTGWVILDPDLGRYGTKYTLRAFAAVFAFAALTREEAMYFTTNIDEDRKRLHGRNRFVLRFAKDGLPPVDAFWSLTMYSIEKDMRSFLVWNPIDRYSVGDRTKGLKYNEDGSLDIYIQHDSPGPDKESNWLPAPADVFMLALRAYQPRRELLEGRYLMPPVRRIE
jgi:hypothetical protein